MHIPAALLRTGINQCLARVSAFAAFIISIIEAIQNAVSPPSALITASQRSLIVVLIKFLTSASVIVSQALVIAARSLL